MKENVCHLSPTKEDDVEQLRHVLSTLFECVGVVQSLHGAVDATEELSTPDSLSMFCSFRMTKEYHMQSSAQA